MTTMTTNNDNDNYERSDALILAAVQEYLVNGHTVGPSKLMKLLRNENSRQLLENAVDGSELATAFVCGGHHRHTEFIQAFLNRGINVDIKDTRGCTALMNAAHNGREEYVRLLLDYDANVDLQNNHGKTALLFACQYGFPNIVKILLERNANPNIQCNRGDTALMGASERVNCEILQELLLYNPDVSLKNNRGQTAHDFARTQEVKDLLQNHVNNTYVLK